MSKFIVSLFVFCFISHFVRASFSQVAKKTSKDNSTVDYLRSALSNLTQSESLGEDSLEQLACQRESLERIQGKMTRIDDHLDRSDVTLTELENPWSSSFVPTRSSGRRGQEQKIGKALHIKNPDLIMDGLVTKRSKWLRRWRTRYFKLQGSELFYFKNKGDKIPHGKIPLQRSRVYEVPSHVCSKKYSFEIIPEGKKRGFLCFVKTQKDYDTWVRLIRRQIKQKNSKQPMRKDKDNPFLSQKKSHKSSNMRHQTQASATHQRQTKKSGEEYDQLLDGILASLDNLEHMGRQMGREIEDQTGMISHMNGDVDQLTDRVRYNTRRVRRVKCR